MPPLPGALKAPAGAPSPAPAGVPAGGQPGPGGPTPTPLTTPQGNQGMEKAARVQIQVAIKMLQRELPNFPIESDENKAVLSALNTLGRAFGKTEDKDRELIPAEIMQMLGAVGPGSTPPGAAAMGAKPMPGMGAPSPAPQPG